MLSVFGVQLGRRINHWRTKAGLTQVELAKIVGVTDAAVSMWETDKNPPTQKNLAAIADACGISLAKFWGAIPKAKAAS